MNIKLPLYFYRFVYCAALIFLVACTSKNESKVLVFAIQELNNSAYPDNPDIGFRSEQYSFNAFKTGEIEAVEKGYKLVFRLTSGDSIRFEHIDLENFIPVIPKHLRKSSYLSKLALINQEWNRNQVKFVKGDFETSSKRITRVDIARNCLNSYLWEVILYEEIEGKTMTFAHGWFDFPHDEYHSLFQIHNKGWFDRLRVHLVDWKDPESEKIPLAVLRTRKSRIPCNFTDESDAMYPMKNARLQKRKEVIYPKSFTSMRALQNDSTLFATFIPPGYYSKSDPRTTQLGRFRILDKVQVFSTVSGNENKPGTEFVFSFSDEKRERMTKFVLGGIDLAKIPTLATESANEGWKSSMGFGNHPFYESYHQFKQLNSKNSIYYAYLSTGNDFWLDSHQIGIDGPILHWDAVETNKLHVWLLSFERHALIGHYVLQLDREE